MRSFRLFTRINMDSSKAEPFKTVLAMLLNIFIFRHKSKKPIIIVKLDFEKAFYKVQYNAIIAMLKAKGFGPRWINGVLKILYFAIAPVLLKGVVGKTIHCKRGVRQGDPHSPCYMP